MPDKKKLVKVDGLGVVEFPGDMPDEHIGKAIKTHKDRPVSSDSDNSLPDYSQVPAFIKSRIDMSKVKQVPTTPTTDLERNAIASTRGTDPYTIKVFSTDLYGPPIQHHELTHTYQDTRNNAILPVAKEPNSQGNYTEYDYGGIDGLREAQKSGKSISGFNYEQQAEIVKDYKVFHDQYLKKAATGKITPEDERKMYELQQVYHPFIRQLADMPGQKENLNRNPLLELIGIQKPVPLARQPDPPGLPSYDTPGLGVLPADPLMGGRSQSTVPTKALSLDEVKSKADDLHKQFYKSGFSQPPKEKSLPSQPKEALNKYPNPEAQPPKVSFEFNKGWSKPGPYATKLVPSEEQEFRKWAAANPNSVRGEVGPAPNFDPLPMADYDIRGHFHAAKTGDPAATLVPNKWDGKLHGNDKFKTPYNGGFSNESMYAMPNAPRWVGNRLMTHNGRLVTDETPRKPGGQK